MGIFDWFKKEKISQETEPEIIIPSEELLEVLENLKKKEIRINYQQVDEEVLDIFMGEGLLQPCTKAHLLRLGIFFSIKFGIVFFHFETKPFI